MMMNHQVKINLNQSIFSIYIRHANG